jgi:uncharacterized protein (DUF3820 family)
MKLTFGKYKGEELSSVPTEYLHWLADPKLKDGSVFNVADDIKQEAKHILANKTYSEDRLAGKPDAATIYVIERLGDISGMTFHDSLKDAITHLEDSYPLSVDGRFTPDPEDDRILIWEVLPSGHKKVVWHFSGWHWDADEFYELPQGKLNGDTDSLYHIACIE